MERYRIIRTPADNLLKHRDGLLIAPGLRERQAYSTALVWKVRIIRKRFSQVVNHFSWRGAAKPTARGRLIVFELAGRQLDCLTENGEGFGRPVQVVQINGSQQFPRFQPAWLDFERPLQMRRSFLGAASSQQRACKVVK